MHFWLEYLYKHLITPFCKGPHKGNFMSCINQLRWYFIIQKLCCINSSGWSIISFFTPIPLSFTFLFTYWNEVVSVELLLSIRCFQCFYCKWYKDARHVLFCLLLNKLIWKKFWRVYVTWDIIIYFRTSCAYRTTNSCYYLDQYWKKFLRIEMNVTVDI